MVEMKTKQEYLNLINEDIKYFTSEKTKIKEKENLFRMRLAYTVFEDLIKSQKDKFIQDVCFEFLMKSNGKVKYKGDL
jgi:hypothetical protein